MRIRFADISQMLRVADVADLRSGARLCEAQHAQSMRMPLNRIGMLRSCPWNFSSNAKCSEGCRRIGNQPSLLRRSRTQTNTGPDRQAKRMKRILRRCLSLFHVTSLTLLLRIELLAGAGEDREDPGRFQSRVHRLESAIERQRK